MARIKLVDFGYVEPKHAACDAWLVNWARWSMNRSGSGASPMFRMYRSTDANQAYGLVASTPIDALKAADAQKAVAALPIMNRQAISWHYIKKNNPRKAAVTLGCTLDGLALLVRNGRQMLINRGVVPVDGFGIA